jgi:glycosyltransferase involved in cell wall biosynthesis
VQAQLEHETDYRAEARAAQAYRAALGDDPVLTVPVVDEEHCTDHILATEFAAGVPVVASAVGGLTALAPAASLVPPDDPAALATETREFLATRGIPLTAWAFADPLGRALVSDTLGIEGIPATFLVGPDARVRRAWVGFRAGDEADMSRAVLAALQEQPAPAETP